MPRKTPSWWSEESGWPAIALSPLAAIYGAAVKARFARATPYKARIPVICVGNFTMGGAGKTPLAIALAKLLIARGERPAFLTRGYRGREAGPVWVDAARHSAVDVGDEPLLLARHAPVMVARVRPDGARAIEKTNASVIIMDDGFQNPSLHKDLSIIAVDGGFGLGNGRVFPAGPLRAPLDFQAPRTDAIVTIGGTARTRSGAQGGKNLEHRTFNRTQIVVARRLLPPWRFIPWLDFKAGLLRSARKDVVPDFSAVALTAALQPVSAEWLRDALVFAFCGIGRPEKFFETLRGSGAVVAGSQSFSDHHVYDATDAGRLISSARRLNAQLVTTEKDFVRLPANGGGTIADLRSVVRPLAVELTFTKEDEGKLSDLFSSVLNRANSY